MTRYAPYYCEENIWWLCQAPRFEGLEREVVVVSNRLRTCAVFSQRAARSPGEPVVWDYHVVLAVRAETGHEVWDLDCALGAPLSAARWLDASFDPALPPSLLPRFRVVPAEEYVTTFSSDRGHMRDEHGRHRAPPPEWPCILSGSRPLERLIDVEGEPLVELFDLLGLRARYGVGPSRAR